MYGGDFRKGKNKCCSVTQIADMTRFGNIDLHSCIVQIYKFCWVRSLRYCTALIFVPFLKLPPYSSVPQEGHHYPDPSHEYSFMT